MRQENFNAKKERPAPELSVNDWEKYEIPITNYGFSDYFTRLWLPEIIAKNSEQQKWLVDDLKKEIIKTLSEKPGYILDIGAGKSDAMIELNKALVEQGSEPKAVRLDLSYGNSDILGVKKIVEIIKILKDGNRLADAKIIEDIIEKENKNLTAICADAFHLPFKDEKFQLAVSNELIPYFLENRDSDEYKQFLRRRQLSWRLSELNDRAMSLDCPPLTEKETGEFTSAVSEINSLPKLTNSMYDLDLFERFFEETSRILKNGLQSPAEARLYPFTPRMLISENKGAKNNQERIKNFIAIVKKNFKSAKFYPNRNISPDHIRDMRKAGLFDLMEECYKTLPKDAADNLRKVIVSPDDLAYPGVLVLQK